MSQECLFSEGLVDADKIGVNARMEGVDLKGLFEGLAGFFEALEVVVRASEVDVGRDIAGVEGEGGFQGGDDLFVASEGKEGEGHLVLEAWVAIFEVVFGFSVFKECGLVASIPSKHLTEAEVAVAEFFGGGGFVPEVAFAVFLFFGFFGFMSFDDVLFGHDPCDIAEFLLFHIPLPSVEKIVEGESSGTSDGVGDGDALVDGLEQLGEGGSSLAMDKIEDHGVDLGVGLCGHLLAWEFGHRGVHLLEGNELIVLEGFGEQTFGVGAEFGGGILSPEGFRVASESFVEPDRDAFGDAVDQEVGEFMDGGIEPSVALKERARGGEHDAVVFAKSDGSCAEDIGFGEWGHGGEFEGFAQEIDADLVGRVVAKELAKAGACAFEGIGEIGGDGGFL